MTRQLAQILEGSHLYLRDCVQQVSELLRKLALLLLSGFRRRDGIRPIHLVSGARHRFAFLDFPVCSLYLRAMTFRPSGWPKYAGCLINQSCPFDFS